MSGDCLLVWKEQLHTGRHAVMTVCSVRSAPTPVARCQPPALHCLRCHLSRCGCTHSSLLSLKSRAAAKVLSPFFSLFLFFSISQDTPPSALWDHQRLYCEIFHDLYARLRRVSFIKAVSKCPILHLLLEGRGLISFFYPGLVP